VKQGDFLTSLFAEVSTRINVRARFQPCHKTKLHHPHCHPDRSKPIFSSHPTSCWMVGSRGGGISLKFSPPPCAFSALHAPTSGPGFNRAATENTPPVIPNLVRLLNEVRNLLFHCTSQAMNLFPSHVSENESAFQFFPCSGEFISPSFFSSLLLCRQFKLVIPTEASQFFLPIQLPVGWLARAVEGSLFRSDRRKNVLRNTRIKIP
jgi:hypothetical protein